MCNSLFSKSMFLKQISLLKDLIFFGRISENVVNTFHFQMMGLRLMRGKDHSEAHGKR